MKTNDFLTEQKLQELGWQDVKSSAIKGLVAQGSGIGAVAPTHDTTAKDKTTAVTNESTDFSGIIWNQMKAGK